MFKRILVAVDGSETSNKALATAVHMARENGARVRLVHAFDMTVPPAYEYSAEVMEAYQQEAAKILEDAMAKATAAGVPAETRLLESPRRHLGESVADEARKWEADLIVVGTHGRRGIQRVLLGSGAEQVIRTAPLPVLAVRTPGAGA